MNHYKSLRFSPEEIYKLMVADHSGGSPSHDKPTYNVEKKRVYKHIVQYNNSDHYHL